MSDPIVIAAVISGSLSFVPATIAALAAWDARKSVGRPNGQGNVIQMNERQLKQLGRIEERLNSHIKDHSVHRRLSE